VIIERERNAVLCLANIRQSFAGYVSTSVLALNEYEAICVMCRGFVARSPN
jgi:hypothetical protein